MLSDEELVVEIKNGSEAALEMIVKRYYNQIFCYVVRRIKDHHYALDITQEVFIKVISGINSFSSEKGKFSSWIFKIAINTCRNYFKCGMYKSTMREISICDEIQCTSNVISLLEKKEDQRVILNAINELPDFQKEVIILKFYFDKKFIEIAELTESNESTVKSRFRQGLCKLKVILEREGLKSDEYNKKTTGT